MHTKEVSGFVYYGVRLVLHLSVQNLAACWLGVGIMTPCDLPGFGSRHNGRPDSNKDKTYSSPGIDCYANFFFLFLLLLA